MSSCFFALSTSDSASSWQRDRYQTRAGNDHVAAGLLQLTVGRPTKSVTEPLQRVQKAVVRVIDKLDAYAATTLVK